MTQQNGTTWNQKAPNAWSGETWGSTQPMNDQEIAFDLLYQEKSLMANVTSDFLEVSHPGMRQVLTDAYNQMGQDQLQLFNLMQQQGWYQTKPAQQPDVQTAKDKYQQMRNTL